MLFSFFSLLLFVVMGVIVSVVLITHSFFKHWLETTPLIINPIKLIAKVLNYARKNKYPRNRSALTYWEENYPSQLDLGKGSRKCEDSVTYDSSDDLYCWTQLCR